MAESGNCPTDKVSHMDIKPIDCEEGRLKLEDMYGFQEHQLCLPERLLPLPDIDSKIESVLGRNLEAYVDDIVIKSNDEKMLLVVIVETFDNLRRINVKLNPKKCSFRMEDGKFLGYMRRQKEPSRRLKTHNRTSLIDHSDEGRSIICIPGSGSRGGTNAGGAQSELFFTIPTQREEEDVTNTTLFTDRASNTKCFGAGLVLTNPSGTEFTYVIHLNFISTNIEAEYEALLAGLCIASRMKEIFVEVLSERSTDRKEINAMIKKEEDNWMTPIIKCLNERVWPKDKNKARVLRMKINQYVLKEKSYLVPMLRTMMIRENENEEELCLNMDLLQERRDAATIREAKYKSKMEQYYNQRARPISFKPR
uniref:Ribonuclease H-like domain-containing protein n=1 Tax=Tanacetum cinerariifolium TaxID=118510 RepID=A0A6L2JKF4_TANCI|nr:ribonuclease H-like domain-containing protein [Tanacetum cinerariifolium]